MNVRIKSFPAPTLGRVNKPEGELIYRAFREDGTPLGMGDYALWNLESRIRSFYPHAHILPGVTPGNG